MNDSHHRGIRSFVLRQGRQTEAQSRALTEQWPVYGIESTTTLLDLDRIFGRANPKILDIGSGMGETLVELARRHPDNDYLGVEVHRPGIGNLMKSAALLGLTNIRVINQDVMQVLAGRIGHQTLDQVTINFPDPWPKKRHHKRRLVNPAFLALLIPTLRHHARLFLATDWEDLAQHMVTECDRCPQLLNLAGTGNFSPRPAWRPETKFEGRGLRLGHELYDLCYAVRQR